MTEITNPIFDLSYSYRKDNSVDAVNHITFYDTTNGFTAAGQVGSPPPVGNAQDHFTFRCNDVNSWWRPALGFIRVQCAVYNQETNGTAPGNHTYHALEDDIRTIFNRIILRLNGEVVEDKPHHVFREWYYDRSTWSKQYAETVGSAMFVDPAGDEFNAYKSTGVGSVKAPGNYEPILLAPTNIALADMKKSDEWNTRLHPLGRRYNYCAQYGQGTGSAQSMEFYIPLYHLFNCFKVYDKVIKGCPIEIELYTVKDEIRIHRRATQVNGVTASALKSVLKWNEAGLSLILPRVIPSPSTEAMLNRQLIAGLSVPIKFEKSYVYRDSIDTGKTNGQWRVTNTASRPTKIVVFTVKQDSEQNQTDALWEPHNAVQNRVNRISMFVNGRKVPSEDVKNESMQSSQQVFRMWNEALHNYDQPYLRNFGMVAGLRDFQSVNFKVPMYVFDLSKRELSEFVGGASELVVDWHYDAATTDPQFMYALVYTESELTLNMTEHSTMITVR